jgi:hypothetical protein
LPTIRARASRCISRRTVTIRKRPRIRSATGTCLRRQRGSLRQKYGSREARALLEVLRTYERDRPFWDHQLDALAAFATPDSFHLVQLQRPVPPLVVVADSFHVKPLLRIMQSADRYQVLCLSQARVALYEGNRDALDEVELERVPRSLTEALGEELTEPHLTVASYNGAGGPAMHHGHGSRADEDEIDVLRYLRAVDRAVWEHHSGVSGLPLILAALPQYQPIFRHVSHNLNLVRIDANPDALSADRLREEAWRVFEPRHLAHVTGLVDRYRAAAVRQAGSDDVLEVSKAATCGRVQALLVDADFHLGGKVDRATRRVEYGKLSDPECDDVLDDVAERVLRTGGRVYALPGAQMPSRSGLAAVFRY